MPYKLLYTPTPKTLDLAIKIAENVTLLDKKTGFHNNKNFHMDRRVATIHATTAIEGNSLTKEDVQDVINGIPVVGKAQDIKEVKNAYAAYDQIMAYDPYSVKDLLRAHKLMTDGVLAEDCGQFRNCQVSVDGYLGASAVLVPNLVSDLFKFLRDSQYEPLTQSAIVHHELEIIHPFRDGNGRMGRLWQTLMLAKWNPIFASLSMESVINENKDDYYNAIERSRKAFDANKFVEYSMETINKELSKVLAYQRSKDRGGSRFVEGNQGNIQ